MFIHDLETGRMCLKSDRPWKNLKDMKPVCVLTKRGSLRF